MKKITRILLCFSPFIIQAAFATQLPTFKEMPVNEQTLSQDVRPIFKKAEPDVDKITIFTHVYGMTETSMANQTINPAGYTFFHLVNGKSEEKTYILSLEHCFWQVIANKQTCDTTTEKISVLPESFKTKDFYKTITFMTEPYEIYVLDTFATVKEVGGNVVFETNDRSRLVVTG